MKVIVCYFHRQWTRVHNPVINSYYSVLAYSVPPLAEVFKPAVFIFHSGVEGYT